MTVLAAAAGLLALAALAVFLPRWLITRAQDRLASRLLAESGGSFQLLTRAELVTGEHRRIPGVLGLRENAVSFSGLFGESELLPTSRIQKIATGQRLASGRKLLRLEVLRFTRPGDEELEFVLAPRLGRRLAKPPRPLGRRRAQVGDGPRHARPLTRRALVYSPRDMTKRSAALGLAASMLASAAAAQTPTPRLLAPGVVSTGDIEFSPALMPDGKTLYFTKGSPGMKRAMWIVVSRLENGTWTTPEIAPFSGRYNDIDPTISPDGKRLFFASTRPTEGTRAEEGLRSLGHGPNGLGLERAPEPRRPRQQRRLGDDNLRHRRRDALHRRIRARTRASHGSEALPVALRRRPLRDSRAPPGARRRRRRGFQPIRLSRRPLHDLHVEAVRAPRAGLYVTYFENGAWSSPAPLDAKLNAAYSPYTPLISPDGKTFYFTSVKGAFDDPPIAPMTYAKFVEAMRAPGNGLADIYELAVEALSLRPAR